MKAYTIRYLIAGAAFLSACQSNSTPKEAGTSDSLETADSLSSTEADGRTYPGNTGVDTTTTKILPNTAGNPNNNNYKGDYDTNKSKVINDTGGYRSK